MTLKLIAIDMDETFLRTDKTYDIPQFKRILSAMKERNTIVCIASGNSYHKLEEYFDEDDKDWLYFAGDNGNYIVKDHQMLRSVAIEPATLANIVDFVDEFAGYHITVSVGTTTYFRESEGPVFDMVGRYNNNIKIVDSFNEIPKTESVVKIAIFSEHSLAQSKTLVRIANQRYEDISAVTSGDSWLDLYHVGGGKGSAIQYLQAKYEIKPEETIAFGDSLNDASMMSHAHYNVAMGNADTDLVVDCHYQIGTNNDQSVIAILNQYLETDSLDFMKQYRTKKKF